MGREYCIHMVHIEDDCDECDVETELAEQDYWARARTWQALRDFLDGTAEQWQQAVADAYNEGLEDSDLRHWD